MGSPWDPLGHLDDITRLAVFTVSSLSPWEGSIMILEQSSGSLPKKIRTGKALAEPLGQHSLDMCSGHPEPEAGRKVGVTRSGEKD